MTDIKEQPIIMSAESIRAILAGHKTQTRRVVTPQPEPPSPDTEGLRGEVDADGRILWRWSQDGHAREWGWARRFPWRVGVRLWVREAWQAGMSDNGPCVAYKADMDRFYPDWQGWREFPYALYPTNAWRQGHWIADVERRGPYQSSIHMPRWASRLTLEITEVRVERVRDITEADARAEGARDYIQGISGPVRSDRLTNLACRYTKRIDPKATVCNDRGYFAALWDEINARRGYSWLANPWVFAITFRKVEMP